MRNDSFFQATDNTAHLTLYIRRGHTSECSIWSRVDKHWSKTLVTFGGDSDVGDIVTGDVLTSGFLKFSLLLLRKHDG